MNDIIIKEKVFSLLNHMQDGVFVIESEKLIYLNNTLINMLEYSEAECIGKSFGMFIYEEDRALVFGNYQKRSNGEVTPDEYEFRLISKTGKIIDVRINVGRDSSESGSMLSIGTLHDITERKRTISALAQSQVDIHSILDNMSDVFYRVDMKGVITMISPSCKEGLGYDDFEMIGQPMASFYAFPEEREKVIHSLQEGKGKAKNVQASMRNKDGNIEWVSTNAYIKYNTNNEPVCIEGISRNVSEQKNMEMKLKKFAQIDDLTQMYNRRFFMQEATQQLELATRYKHPVCVLMIDLDHFKKVNDAYGHHAGDEALKHFSNLGKEFLRKTDIFGRVGGEEFAVMLPETSKEEALVFAERLRASFDESKLLINEEEINLTLSLGIAFKESHENKSMDTLLNQADKALYKAKEERNSVELFKEVP